MAKEKLNTKTKNQVRIYRRRLKPPVRCFVATCENKWKKPSRENATFLGSDFWITRVLLDDDTQARTFHFDWISFKPGVMKR